MADRVDPATLVFNPDLYPRHGLSDGNLQRLKQVREAGREFDPIVACDSTKVIIDGVHRWTVASRLHDETIAVEWRSFDSDAERFRVATQLNTNHGLSLSTHDRLRVIEIGEGLGLREPDIADSLAVSVSYLRAIKPRYATVSEAVGDTSNLRKVPLKASVRHLSGTEITAEQEREIMGSAPGSSYLLLVRQLARAIDLGLLPPRAQHPALWASLEQLGLRIRSAVS